MSIGDVHSKTILVTGGAGYIGSHTVLELLEVGHRVVVIDNFVNAVRSSSGLKTKAESLTRVEELTGKSVELHDGDLLDKDSLRPVFQLYKIDCVIHFAALKAVGESVLKPLTYYKNNITGTIHLLEVMLEFGVQKIVFSSSCTVYGEPQYLPLNEAHQTGVGCTNPYGKSKYFTEEVLQDTCVADKNWSIISLRYFNPVGAHASGRIGEDPNEIPNNLMPFIAQVAVGRHPEVKVFGGDYNTTDGTGVRDYIHVVDLAKGHLCAIDKLWEDTGFKVYNLGTSKGYSVLEVISTFEKATGKKIPYTIVDRRQGDVACVYADVSFANEQLGWKAERTLDEMCKDHWNWQSQNPMGYQQCDS